MASWACDKDGIPYLDEDLEERFIESEKDWTMFSDESESRFIRTDRLQVPNGWIYRTVCSEGAEDSSSVAMVFVPEVHRG